MKRYACTTFFLLFFTACSSDPSPKVFDCEVGFSERNIPFSGLNKDKRINIVLNLDPLGPSEEDEFLSEEILELKQNTYKAKVWPTGDDELIGTNFSCTYSEEVKTYLCRQKIDILNVIASLEAETGEFLFQSKTEEDEIRITQTMSGKCKKR